MSNATIASGTTGADGSYSLVAPEGTYNIRFIPPAGSQFTATTVQQFRVAGDSHLDVVLRPFGRFSLSGVIRDFNGAPVAGVRIFVLAGSQSPPEIETSADGSYRFTDVPQGPVAIRLHPGTATGLPTGFWQMVTKELPLSQDTVLDLTLPKVVVLSVRVTGPAGNPLPGAVASAYGPVVGQLAPGLSVNEPANSIQSSSGPTDSNGVARVPLFTAGSVSGEVSPPPGSDLPTTTFPVGSLTADATVVIHFAPPLVVYRPSSGVWYSRSTGSADIVRSWGTDGDMPVAADYDGDGLADEAVFRPSTGTWYVRQSSDGAEYGVAWGTSGDVPVASDFDGDKKADLAVFRPSSGVWFVRRNTDGSVFGTAWGIDGDIPAAADFDGDKKADIAVFRPSNGVWYVRHSSDQGVSNTYYGTQGDVPAAADYDGDGKVDFAVFRPDTGTWYIHRTTDNADIAIAYGIAGDIPVAADYDGDGKADLGVFRPSNGVWYLLRSSGGGTVTPFGASGDIPQPLPAGVQSLFVK